MSVFDGFLVFWVKQYLRPGQLLDRDCAEEALSDLEMTSRWVIGGMHVVSLRFDLAAAYLGIQKWGADTDV